MMGESMFFRLRRPMLAGLSALLPVAAFGVASPQVTGFTPAGSAETVRQVTARFSTPMVQFGDPTAADPFTVDCPVRGEGRWADARTWVYDYPAALPGGVRCSFTARPGLASATGQALTGQTRFAFDTGGPSIRAVLPDEGSEVDEDQTFLVAVNGTPDLASVRRGAACAVDGVGESIAVDILPQASRDKLLAEAGRDWPVRGFLEQAGIARIADEPGARTAQLAGIVALKCRRAVPPSRDVALLWPASIRTANGFSAGRDRRIGYRVRAPFTARAECRRVNPDAGCNPVEDARISFSAPISRVDAAKIRLVAGKNQIAPTFDDEDMRNNVVSSARFAAPLPAATTVRVTLPAGLKDQSGRALANADRFPLDLQIDEAPPLVKFAAGFGLLEQKEGGVLPVTVRNVEPALAVRATGIAGQALLTGASDAEVAAWLRRLEQAERSQTEEVKRGGETVTINRTRETPLLAGGEGRPLDIALPGKGRSFEVVGIPLGTPGFHIVELASPRLGRALLGRDTPRYVAAGALVTNMSVHFKWGREASLAWVTRLDNGMPVTGADVAVSNSCTGARLAAGRTDRFGRLLIKGGLPEPRSYGDCADEDAHPLMVSARANGDFSFSLTSWDKGIAPYDFDMPFGWSARTEMLRTVFDRTLIRAGDTVSMKHILRRPVAAGFAFPAQPYEGILSLRHSGSGEAFEMPVRIGRDGIGETAWAAPKDARLGDYSLEFKSGDQTIWSDARLRVDEYRLPTMTASIQGPKQVQVNPGQVPVDLYVGYLSGGGAGGTPVKLRALIQPRSVDATGFEGYSFGGDAIVEGARPLDGSGEADPASGARVQMIPATLGPGGGARVAIPGPFKVDQPSNLRVEMDYEDANGEVLTASARIPIDPAQIRLGIRTDGWLMKDGDLRLKLLVLDADNRPVRGQGVRVELFSREILSSRRRLIGGFYAYDNLERTKKIIGKSCTGATDRLGIVTCALEPGVSGEVYVQAAATDKAGNIARATRSVWLVGEDEWWFGGDNGDRMDVIPERTEYGPDETARLQVRMPFRAATALVTVEREGVLSSFVTALSGNNAVVEVPMQGAYAPNVYVSVMAVRGRVAGWRLWLSQLARDWNLPFFSRDGARPTALVDLARPSYRIGMARLRVGWDTHRLAVDVSTEAEKYRVRQTANVDIAVAAPAGRRLPADAEVAITAVDEALLQLQPNESWALLDGMMGQRDLSVLTSTAQMQVVGKRHYGRKAVEAGGGGGMDMSAVARENFQPLLLWRGRVKLDAAGRARVQVPLSDALSSFRIVAVATAGPDLFGTGETKVRTVQDLSIFAGVPPVVRDGDRYQAVFTLRNGSERPMKVTAAATVTPAVMTGPPISIDLNPGEARAVFWNATAPSGLDQLVWQVAVASADGSASDRLRVTQSIIPAVPDAVLQSTLLRVDGSADLPVQRPAGALPRRGGVQVALSPGLTTSLAGVRAYMQAYPYTCLEQLASRAVALDAPALWDETMGRLPLYLDGAGLARYFPTDGLDGSPVLTAYLLSIAAEDGRTIPDAPRGRMIEGLTGFVDGRVERPDWFTGSMTIRKLSAIAALARHGAARPAMLDGLDADPRDLPTGALIDLITIVQRLPGIRDAGPRLAAAEQVLRSRLDTQGTTLALRTGAGDALWWMMNSGDESAVRATLAVMERPGWRADAPLLLRGAIGRQKQGRWDNTTANAWGSVAVRRFAARFESAAVSGSTSVTLGNARRSVAFAGAAQPTPVTLGWPTGGGTLLLRHQGGGAPWAVVTSRAAVPLTRPLASGYRLAREMIPVEQAVKGRWTRGDVVRVRLTVEAAAERSWVVVDDPIPAGATIVSDLGGQSSLLGSGAQDRGAASLGYVERRQDSYRAYYSWVPNGRFTTEYVVRLNGAGRFNLPPTRVEALYSPEAFAMVPNAPVVVVQR
jgi:hypothetical protein